MLTNSRPVKFLLLLGILTILFTSVYAATFITKTEADFNNGTYVNTTYNTDHVELQGANLSGTYTSKIFDATADATWNNLTNTFIINNVNYLFGVDGGGDVYKSINLGVNWSMTKQDFGRTSDTQEMFSDSDYLYIISNSNREVWRSNDSGINWRVINDSFANSAVLVGEVDSSGNLFIADGSGDVYISNNDGITWTLQGDFNGGATNNARGMGIDPSGNIYILDGSKAVFNSSDLGATWKQKTSDYGGGGTSSDDLEADSSGNLYILDNKDVWKSIDQGQNWNKINDSFTSYSNDGVRMLIDDGDNFFIADANGRIFKSTNSGVTWSEEGDFNAGASSNPKGLTDFYQPTNLTYQVRNCSASDCSDGTWQSVDLSNIDLTGRYFQYKTNFITPNSSVSPELYNITVDYIIICITNLTNTSWTEWVNLTCLGDQMNQSRSRTQYDSNNCGEISNQTFFEYQLTGPQLQNTSWTEWTNISCLSDDTVNQTRNRTQYDIYSCSANTTIIEYRNTEFCDYCTPLLTNTSWSNWTNISCLPNNKMNQSRSLIQYDSNNCGEVANETFIEYQATEDCNTTTPYCGDGNCDDSESCSSCSQDCGSCPPENGGSSGGGRGDGSHRAEPIIDSIFQVKEPELTVVEEIQEEPEVAEEVSLAGAAVRTANIETYIPIGILVLCIVMAGAFIYVRKRK